jgi:TolB-like protein
MAAVLRDEPPDMDECGTQFPVELKQLVARCLAKQPEGRFQSANDLAISLKSLRGADAGPAPMSVSATHTRPCVAVLPLQNLSANKPETEYLVDGMTEALIAELAKMRTLRVVSRTTVMQFKDSRRPLRQIAHELEADAIVEGSLLITGSRVRITAQLIRADIDEHLWAESYEREVGDALIMQSEVARAVAQKINEVLFHEAFHSESRRVLATLIRLLGDFDLAEEALHEALAAGVEQWSCEGIPPHPRAWLVSTGLFKVIAAVRGRARLDASLQPTARRLDQITHAIKTSKTTASA